MSLITAEINELSAEQERIYSQLGRMMASAERVQVSARLLQIDKRLEELWTLRRRERAGQDYEGAMGYGQQFGTWPATDATRPAERSGVGWVR